MHNVQHPVGDSIFSRHTSHVIYDWRTAYIGKGESSKFECAAMCKHYTSARAGIETGVVILDIIVALVSPLQVEWNLCGNSANQAWRVLNASFYKRTEAVIFRFRHSVGVAWASQDRIVSPSTQQESTKLVYIECCILSPCCINRFMLPPYNLLFIERSIASALKSCLLRVDLGTSPLLM